MIYRITIKNLITVIMAVCCIYTTMILPVYADELLSTEPSALPEAPKDVYASLYGHDDVLLSWDASQGAGGYHVYYRESTSEEYTKAGTTEETSFKISDLKDHVKYSFRIVPYCINETDGNVYEASSFGSTEITTKKNINAPSRVSAYLYGYDDIKISWTKSSGANGYYIYYKKNTSSKYTYLGFTTNRYYKKANLSDGVKYTFKVVPRYKASGKNHSGYYSKEASITTLKKTSVSLKRMGFNKLQMSWVNISGESGYQISRSSKKSKTNIVYTYKSSTASKKNLYPKLGKKYYYKIRAYKVSNGKRIYGPWSPVVAKTLSRNYYPKVSLITKNGKFLDVRKEAGQRLYGYDIFQGSCTDGENGYYILYNKSKEKCKIAKVRLSDNEVIKVSKVLNIHHGNDLTYNSKTNTILAVHLRCKPKTIAMIDPVTLRLKKNKTIVIPSKLSGATSSKLKKIKAFNAIAYDQAKNRYVLRIKGTGDYLITDKNLKPVKYITPSVKKHKGRLYAGIDIINGYIASSQASSDTGTFARYNVIQLYDRSGRYKGCINVRKGYEMESIFNNKGKVYATFYHEYYKNGKLMRNNYIYEFAF